MLEDEGLPAPPPWLKDDAVKVLHSIYQQIWKTAVAIGLEKVSFHSNPKERQCQQLHSSHMLVGFLRSKNGHFCELLKCLPGLAVDTCAWSQAAAHVEKQSLPSPGPRELPAPGPQPWEVLPSTCSTLRHQSCGTSVS